jgi:DNA-binding transcriptional regulator YdaS (Cro superfamily)
MLKLKTWLDAERGRATSLANHLGVSLSRVSQFADDGVPPKYMLAVRDFSHGEVTLDSMVQERTPAPAATEAKEAAHG